MSYVPLIQTTRGGMTECVHYGAIAVVDTAGKVLAQVGNAQHRVFTRSTLKALQALPLMQSGAAQALKFAPHHVALLCASHSGEEMHVAGVQDMLAKANVPVTRLQCGCHVPLRYSFFDIAPPAGATFTPLHNNCSGKHAGFLAWCAHQGVADDTYLDPAHPLQRAIRTQVARAVRLAPDDLHMGIDGCSAPNYAMPLAALALGYARLASGAQDVEFGEAFAALSAAMKAHPELVSGTGRNDAAWMQAGAGDWVSKVGADGVQVVGSTAHGQAIAIRIADGNKNALYAASVAALDQLGWLNEAQRTALTPWRFATLTNARGVVVGERKAVFNLSVAQRH
jgi:L-asparaginase II